MKVIDRRYNVSTCLFALVGHLLALGLIASPSFRWPDISVVRVDVTSSVTAVVSSTHSPLYHRCCDRRLLVVASICIRIHLHNLYLTCLLQADFYIPTVSDTDR